ncbi:MAG: LCP family protein [Lachnospiraceae bacterium]|nr:LCP family protein [Lachnospiraceae bacterium]
MSKATKTKKKNPLIRVIAALLIIVIAGGASYIGSKTFFTHKFKAEKEAAAKKEAEELAASIKDQYVTCIRVGDFVALRVLDTKQNKMTIVCMRPDSDLFEYDEEGNGEKMKVIVNNIENAYGVNISGYEDFNQEAFVNLINEGKSFTANLPYPVSFRDMNQMKVNMEAGETTMNGNQSWGVLSGKGMYEEGNADAFIEGAESFIAGYVTAIFTDTDEETLADYVKTIYKNGSSDIEYSEIATYVNIAAKLKPEDISIVSLEGKMNGSTFEADIDAAKDLISDIAEGKAVGKSVSNWTGSTEDTEEAD